MVTIQWLHYWHLMPYTDCYSSGTQKPSHYLGVQQFKGYGIASTTSYTSLNMGGVTKQLV